MTVLFEMEAGDEEFVRARYVRRSRRFSGGWRNGVLYARFGLVGNQFLSILITDANEQVRSGSTSGQLDCRDERVAGRQVALEAAKLLSLDRDCDDRLRVFTRDGNTEAQFTFGDPQADGSFEICLLRRANLLDRIPILTPRFGFAGLQKTEVGLVVGIDAGHDFDVGAEFAARVGVSQIPIPRIASSSAVSVCARMRPASVSLSPSSRPAVSTMV